MTKEKPSPAEALKQAEDVLKWAVKASVMGSVPALRAVKEARPAAEAMEGALREIAAALQAHHNWHLSIDEPDSYAVPDGKGGWVGLNRAEEYAESSMYEQTRAALARAALPEKGESDE